MSLDDPWVANEDQMVVITSPGHSGAGRNPFWCIKMDCGLRRNDAMLEICFVRNFPNLSNRRRSGGIVMAGWNITP